MDNGLGVRLEGARRARLLSQEELAAASGVGRNTIVRIETGAVGRPHGGTLRRLAAALDVDPAWLVAGEAAGGMTGKAVV